MNRDQTSSRGRQAIARNNGLRGGTIINVQPEKPEMKEAEALIAQDAELQQSSFATSMSVLAHTWFSLDQSREAARMTYNRAVRLRGQGREMSTGQVAMNYSEAQVEILIVEEQIVEIVQAIMDREDDGRDAAFHLLGAQHTNLQSGITVMLPTATQARLALAAGLLPSEPGDDGDAVSGTPPSA